MKTTEPKSSARRTTLRLAATYLAIIMLMSVGFSLVFYITSLHQLSQLPSTGGHPNFIGRILFSPEAAQYLQQQIDASKVVLLQRLILLNVVALVAGGLLSYVLARRTLQPIEAAMERQVQFVSDASHELRTPLTAIQTSNEVALRNPKLTLREAKELIRSDTEDIKRLRDLADGLLSLASQGHDNLEVKPVELQEVVSEAMTQIAHRVIEKDVVFQNNLGDVGVQSDRNGLVQLLVILLDNAVKYSHRGGAIHLTAQQKGSYVYIAVRDEGIGIAGQDLPHVFQRFYRADGARTHSGGYGLGLSIAEHIAASNRGSISVTSEVGEGSTFTVKLPMA